MATKKLNSFIIKTAIDEIEAVQWDAISSNNSIYLDRRYLKALETTLSSLHQFYYVIVQDLNKAPTGIITFQSAPFIYTKDKHSKKVLGHFRKDSHGYFSKQLLVCGNVFATGETGFAFSVTLKTFEMGELLLEATSQILKFQKKEEALIKTKVSLFKEFWPESLKIPAQLVENGYQNYQIDVNMVLHIAPHWDTFDDYLEDVKAKYRTRANGVFVKSKNAHIKVLTASQIKTYANRIDELFENVISQSEYRFGEMGAQTFAALKEQLGSLFIFKGIFINETLIGYSTAFLNGDVYEANYVGIDYDYNGLYATYQRLLYDHVEEAIKHRVHTIQMGRTSELLKSSLGAVPRPMTLFAKHTSSITHMLMTSILKKVSASPYELRKPFKATFYNNDLSPLA